MDAVAAALEQALGLPPDRALLAVCRAWAALPSIRLSRLVRTMSANAPAEGVGGATQAAREERWLDLAVTRDAAALQQLLATPWTSRPKDAAKRLALLAGFAPDPRIVHALLDLDTGERFMSGAGNRFWHDAYALMLRWGSTEAAARIPRNDSTRNDPRPFALSRFVNIFADLVRAWEGRWPTEPALTSEHEGLIAQLEARASAPQQVTRRLLESVWTVPGGDTPRQVLADSLTERGDPRGEFIALQFAHERGELTLARRERMGQLLAAAGRRWFDGLDGQVAPTAVFRRGFLSEVQLAVREPDPSLRAWRTVGVLHTGSLALSLTPLLRGGNTAGISDLLAVRGETFLELARSGDGLALSRVELVLLPSRVPAPPKPRIATLRLGADVEEAVAWFLASPLVETTAELELEVSRAPHFTGGALVLERPPSRLPRAGALLAELDRRAPKLQRVTIVSGAAHWPEPWAGAWRLELARDGAGRLGALTLVLEEPDARGYEQVIGALPAGQLSSLAVRAAVRLSPAQRDEVRASLGAALEPQTRLSSRELKLEHAQPRPARGLVHGA